MRTLNAAARDETRKGFYEIFVEHGVVSIAAICFAKAA
jgi:hypothetical protein